MLSTGDYILLGIGFFLVNFVWQTPNLISWKGRDLETLSYHCMLSIATYFAVLANALGPYAMFLAVIITVMSNAFSYMVWKIYFGFVWANNWQDLENFDDGEELRERHVLGYPYQVFFGLDICFSFAILVSILIRANII